MYCGEEKPTIEFVVDKRRKFGYTNCCKLCHGQKCKEYYRSHKKQSFEYSRKWCKKNPEKRKEIYTKSYHRNKEKSDETKREWLKNNPEKRKETMHNYYLRNKKKNKSRGAECCRRRQGMLKQQCPPWADMEMIKAIYSGARIATILFGKEFQVDHIVPLKHKYVTGLHVPDNLQILTKSENSRKNNRFIVEGRN